MLIVPWYVQPAGQGLGPPSVSLRTLRLVFFGARRGTILKRAGSEMRTRLEWLARLRTAVSRATNGGVATTNAIVPVEGQDTRFTSTQ